jgi:hypothetical protein
MVCRSLDDVLRDLKTTADDLWFQGKGSTYLLLMDARSKLLEARALADHITDFEDVLDTETGNMATNFLCSGCRSA